MDEKFRQHLLDTFKIEADERLKSMTLSLLKLEETKDLNEIQDILEVIFRDVHSFKGASRAVDLSYIEMICQAFESVLSRMKENRTIPKLEHFDLFHQINDYLSKSLNEESSMDSEIGHEKLDYFVQELKLLDNEEKPEPEFYEKKEVIREDDKVVLDHSQEDSPVLIQEKKVHKGTRESVRVSTSRLSDVLLQSEELLSAKLITNQRALDLKQVNTTFEGWQKKWTRLEPYYRALSTNQTGGQGENELIIDKTNLQSVEKISEFLAWNKLFINDMEKQYRGIAKSFEKDSLDIGSMVENLLDDMKKVMMFPFSSILEIFPKTVRDLARDRGNKVELEINGGDVEIDRRILEEMKDPFLHIIRNCVDHGIEKVEDRIKKGKPEHGKISIEIVPRSQVVEIIISDDGVGISANKVKEAIKKDKELSHFNTDLFNSQELLSYVYKSGISTSPIITEVSGRGLGLAIVREKVEKLGGTITLRSEENKGTEFRIVIPLTMATLRGILIKLNDHSYIIPTMHVERVLRIHVNEIKTVENHNTIFIEDQSVSIVLLSDILKLDRKTSTHSNSNYQQVVLLNDGGIRVAVCVDEVLNEQEVLFKDLGSQLTRVKNIAGTTVLGTGVAVPIINVADVLKSAVKVSLRSSLEYNFDTSTTKEDQLSVLVVDDSITTRTLLRNVLEVANYKVETAVDGVDGYDMLKKQTFDAVVSDIDMPQMNGFVLTDKIRNDDKLFDLPVILVTALESKEDKEKGIDVGANAYIVKNSFSKSNLLEVLERLIIRRNYND